MLPGRGKALDQRQEPVRPAVAGKTGDLRNVKGQVVGQDAVPGLRLGLRDSLVRLRQLLEVVDAGGQWIDVELRGADPQACAG